MYTGMNLPSSARLLHNSRGKYDRTEDSLLDRWADILPDKSYIFRLDLCNNRDQTANENTSNSQRVLFDS